MSRNRRSCARPGRASEGRPRFRVSGQPFDWRVPTGVMKRVLLTLQKLPFGELLRVEELAQRARCSKVSILTYCGDALLADHRQRVQLGQGRPSFFGSKATIAALRKELDAN